VIEALTSAAAVVTSVLANAPGMNKPKVSKPSLKALPNAPGKVFQPHALSAAKIHAAASAAMAPYLAKLVGASLGSVNQFMKAAEEALQRMIADGTQKITMSSWLGTILEIEGPKHPLVMEITRQLAGASVRFANDAVKNKRVAFIDGTGRVRALPQKLDIADMQEIHDLKINGQKYSDRAFQITDQNGDMFIVLTQEFKTRGNKRRDVDTQQNARSARLVDDSRPAKSKLSYFQAGQKMPDVDLENVLVHIENTEAQIGVKAGTRDSFDQRVQKRTGKDQYKATYHYLKIDWPSREIRFVLQQVWNKL
jgi:hypothetical protein